MGLTNPKGEKKYIAAAFPSQCGKTNLAMMVPNIPGFKLECVGDDIAWMKFDEEGRLRAINPEYGFFGVCPGNNVLRRLQISNKTVDPKVRSFAAVHRLHAVGGWLFHQS